MSEQSQRCFQNAPLLDDVVRLADGRSAGQLSVGSPGRRGQADDPHIPGSQGGSNALYLQSARNQSHGLGTAWSSGNQQGGVDLLLFGRRYNLWDQFIDGSFHIGQIAAKANDPGSQFPNHALGD